MIFYRELLTTRDGEEFSRVCRLLAENKIKYSFSSHSLFTSNRYHGTPFIDSSAARPYRIKVRRKDYFKAEEVLKKA